MVAETLNLQALDGYATGGTVHLIQNNQVGFTTDPEDARSTPYASDLAKGFDVPIIHVNADDVEACIAAVRLAMAYRERWGRDVVIDLIGYRRFGHNETDEPAYTQPRDGGADQGAPAGLARSTPSSWSRRASSPPEEVEERQRASASEELKAAHDELRAKIEAGEYADPTDHRAPASSTARTSPRSRPRSPRSGCAR